MTENTPVGFSGPVSLRRKSRLRPFFVVIPAKNEAASLSALLPALKKLISEGDILVVDDGSTDGTCAVALEHGVRVISHPYSKGNGAAVKRGALAAEGADYIIFMDADGQHDPEDIPRLKAEIEKGYDLVVGARKGLSSQANLARWGANALYNRFASWMVGHRVEDLTSGYRIVNRKKFLSFLYLLPNGFSYPTTSTMAFFRAGYSVAFCPITVRKRIGKSHVSVLRDGVRFFLIIFKVGTLYSPLKVYFPIATLIFCMGLGNYALTYLMSYTLRFTNMSALLMLSGVIVFLIGLLSEQLTTLQYKDMKLTEED